jgi:hypothetical protein
MQFNMQFRCPNLTINTHEEVNRWVIAKPIKGYNITDDSTQGFRYVILYELISGKNVEEILHRAIIPYYVSDGRTNHLRASMLYPFMCFHEYDKDSKKIISSGCLQSNFYIPNLLFKYESISNLDFKYINKWIESKVFNDDTFKYFKYISKSEKDQNGNFITGVLSVLPRIKNLLDFLIAIYSDKINYDVVRNLNDSTIKNYRPNYVGNPFNYNEYADPIQDEKNPWVEFRCDNYRKYLLIFFADMNTNLQKLNIINSYVDLNLEPIRMKDFNNLPDVKVCDDKKINPDRNTNYDNYQNISNNLFSMINTIITTKKNYHELALDKVSYDSEQDCDKSKLILKFINQFNLILKNDIVIPSFTKNLSNWRSTCDPNQLNKRQRIEITGGSIYNKYLKYKAKYLALKKLNSH